MSVILYLANRNYSSWSLRAALLVRLAGLSCQEEIIRLDTEEGKERLKKISPTGCVPVLEYNGMLIWDSLAIAEYLNEQFPDAGIWPEESEERAVARSLSAEMHAGFFQLRSRMPMDIRSQHPVPEMDKGLMRDITRIKSIWSDSRTQYGEGGQYLFGKWCMTDIMFVPVISRFRTYGIELEGAARDYSEAVWQRADVSKLVQKARDEPWSIDLEAMSMGGPAINSKD